MRTAPRVLIAAALAGTALLATDRDAATRQPGVLSVAATHAAGVDELRRWDATVDRMARTGGLVVTSRLADRALPGRIHEYLAQTVDGVPVHGAGVSRQLDAGGVTVSLLGTLHQEVDVDTTPALSGADAAARLEALHGGEVVAGGRPALTILPLPDGSHVLAWRVAMSDGHFYFVDAADGGVVRRVNAIRSQSTVGVGAGSRGDRRKLSTTEGDGRFEAHDRMRPAELVTLDVRFNFQRVLRLLYDHMDEEMPPGEPVWTADDYATDADNDWDDPAVVDAHVHTGWAYDYFSTRHGWEGIDGANGRIISLVNLGAANAFFASPPYGPEGAGVFGYGRATDETSEEPFTFLDVVGHELMHGVTHFAVSNRTRNPDGLWNAVPVGTRLGPRSFTTRGGRTHTCATARFAGLVETPDGADLGLVPAWCVNGRFLLAYAGAGAIHEGYSDIFAESLGFYYEDEGASADYLVGGDLKDGPLRSMADPRSVRDGFHPDAFADRYEFALTRGPFGWEYSGYVFVRGRYFGTLGDDAFGYGGDHWNSLILSHAFYLAVEGGKHRTSGRRVEGVGGANRAEVERIFFRAMTDLMPASASLPTAAKVIRQSAADLAPGSRAERAVQQALRAVGLAR